MTRILLVEDNRGDARLFAELVSEVHGRPFTVTPAETLAAARLIVAEHDIVFLDLSLPDAHGLATVDAMLAETRLPIVVLTGNDDHHIALAAMQRGAQDYLTKAELTPSLIERTVRYALERKRAEEAAKQFAVTEELARAAALLSSVTGAVTASFDLEHTLPQVAKLLVPALADYCVIDLVRDGDVQRVAYAGASPEAQQMLAVSLEYSPGTHHSTSPTLRAIATRETVFSEAAQVAPDDRARSIVAQLQARTMMTTPLVARGRVLGAVNFTMGPSGRDFTETLRRHAEQVSERIALGIDNAMLYAQAQTAIRGRDEMLAVVSHDLRNPLGVVDLALAMIAETPASTEKALPRAKRAVDKMLGLIDDLLEVARIESGTLNIQAEPIPAAAIVEDAAELHRGLAAKHGLSLDVKEVTSKLARADRKRVGQALSNLIGNAIKFTPRGGAIRIGAREHGEAVTFFVEDNGEGIAPDHLAHVFDRFWQPRRRTDGVGLGLAIVKGIVDAHGGKVDVQSAVGRGTTFTIMLPAAAAAAA